MIDPFKIAQKSADLVKWSEKRFKMLDTLQDSESAEFEYRVYSRQKFPRCEHAR